jgi:hypothetical protein
MIPDWKGPKQKDLKLLEPTGGFIMQGLVKGFQKDIPELRRVLGNITDDMPGQVNVTGSGRDNAPGFGGFGGNPPGPAVVQHFEIHTQEIDPKQHGAELGYEVAKRVSH